jgi:hypothetical protein
MHEPMSWCLITLEDEEYVETGSNLGCSVKSLLSFLVAYFATIKLKQATIP